MIPDILLKKPDSVAISIYINVSKNWQNTDQDKTHLKNIIQEIEKKRPKDKKLLEPIFELLTDFNFWKYQKEALAIFSAKNIFEYVKLDKPVEEHYHIGKEFYLEPLESDLLSDMVSYYLLALSQKKNRLFFVSKSKVEQLELPDIPINIDDVIWDDDKEKSFKTKTSLKAGAPSGGGLLFHGHGAFKDSYKKNLEKYFHAIDSELNTRLEDKSLPLVLACVSYLYPIYKDSSTYPLLHPDIVSGNPDNMSDKDLVKKGNKLFKKQKAD